MFRYNEQAREWPMTGVPSAYSGGEGRAGITRKMHRPYDGFCLFCPNSARQAAPGNNQAFRKARKCTTSTAETRVYIDTFPRLFPGDKERWRRYFLSGAETAS